MDFYTKPVVVIDSVRKSGTTLIKVPEENLRSKVANDYYILGIPVIVLVNAKTKEIIALPETIRQLNRLII